MVRAPRPPHTGQAWVLQCWKTWKSTAVSVIMWKWQQSHLEFRVLGLSSAVITANVKYKHIFTLSIDLKNLVWSDYNWLYITTPPNTLSQSPFIETVREILGQIMVSLLFLFVYSTINQEGAVLWVDVWDYTACRYCAYVYWIYSVCRSLLQSWYLW